LVIKKTYFLCPLLQYIEKVAQKFFKIQTLICILKHTKNTQCK
jgi:hypothetical protein